MPLPTGQDTSEEPAKSTQRQRSMINNYLITEPYFKSIHRQRITQNVKQVCIRIPSSYQKGVRGIDHNNNIIHTRVV